MVALNRVAQCVADVAQQVPAVGDLDRFGCALGSAVREGAGAIARDDLDTGMRAQPGRERLGLPVR
jgi:hypothetical protein